METTVQTEISRQKLIYKEEPFRRPINAYRSCPSCQMNDIDWFMGEEYLVHVCHGCGLVW